MTSFLEFEGVAICTLTDTYKVVYFKFISPSTICHLKKQSVKYKF